MPQNFSECAKLLRKSAEQGNDAAMFNLAIMYENGRGVPQNYREAVKWHRMAADHGNMLAEFNLANLYANGRGVPVNWPHAPVRATGRAGEHS